MTITQQIDFLFNEFKYKFPSEKAAALSFGYSSNFYRNRRLSIQSGYRLNQKLVTAISICGYDLELMDKQTGKPYEAEGVTDCIGLVDRIQSAMYEFCEDCRSVEEASEKLDLSWHTMLRHKNKQAKNIMLNDKLVHALDVMGYELVIIERKTGKEYE